MIKIRLAEIEDCDNIVELLNNNFVEPPVEFDEIRDMCFIALQDNTVIGSIWALTGKSSKAYIDYFAVTGEKHCEKVAMKLIKTMRVALETRQIKSFMFHIEKWNIKMYNSINKRKEFKRLNDLFYFRRVMP